MGKGWASMLGRRFSCRCRAQVAICLWTSSPSEAVLHRPCIPEYRDNPRVPLPTWVSNPWQEELGLLSHALTPPSWLCHSVLACSCQEAGHNLCLGCAIHALGATEVELPTEDQVSRPWRWPWALPATSTAGILYHLPHFSYLVGRTPFIFL